MDALMTEIRSESFLTKRLGFTCDPTTSLDLDRLVVMGHKLGGLAALSVSIGDKRVKVVASIDPWFTPYSTEVQKGLFAVKDPTQAVCMLETEHFADEIDKKVKEVNSQREDSELFFENSANKDLQERCYLRHQMSFFVTDHVVLDPLLVTLLTRRTIPDWR